MSVQRPSTSFVTLPLHDMAGSLASAAGATRPATTGAGSRNLRYHPNGSAVLSTLDPASWAAGSTSSSHCSPSKKGLGWHVISKHTPTVSLGK